VITQLILSWVEPTMSVKTIAASLRSVESSGISEEESDQANAHACAGTLPREPVSGATAGS